ncbi:MAG: SPASM domain-containing protein [Candidatus Methanomethylicaceae archaeon]
MSKYRSLDITTIIGCPIRCDKYCPQAEFLEAYKGNEKIMSFENFTKIIRNISKDVVICFSGASEPFLNPQCVDMVEYAYSVGYQVSLFTTLVGLNQNDIQRLSKLSFYSINLHLPDSNNVSKIPITQEYKDVLADALTKLEVTTLVTMNKNFPNNQRAGLRSEKKWSWKQPVTCERLDGSSGFIVLPNGDTYLCCMDFSLKHKVGNLLFQTYDEIVSSKEYKKIKRGAYLFGDVICKQCTLAYPIYLYDMNKLTSRLKRQIKARQNNF